MDGPNVDDRVFISLGSDTQQYTVRNIDAPNQLVYISPIQDLNQTSLLVNVNGEWKVSGESRPHQVQFMPSSQTTALTGIKDTDVIILNLLDDSSLAQACQTNRYANELCQKDEFWRRRVLERIGSDALVYKRDGQSWKQYYRQLVKHHRTWGSEDTAAENGNLNILQWLFESEGVLPSSFGADFAARNGHVDVLQWLAYFKIYPTQYGANLAAGNGQMETLRWLATIGAFPNETGADIAAKNNHTDAVNWLAEMGIITSVSPRRGKSATVF